MTLEQTPDLVSQIEGIEALSSVSERLDTLTDVTQLIASGIADEPPAHLKDGGVIRSGFNAELDEFVQLSTTGKDWILDLESRERDATDIQSLKVKFNRVFGYFIEVRKTHIDRVPEHYIRKQTLTNAERYYTAELKEFEEKVLNAEAKRSALEHELFMSLRTEVSTRDENWRGCQCDC